MNLNSKEQLKLRNKAKRECERLLKIRENSDRLKLICVFKEKFAECEIIYIVNDINYFTKRTNKGKPAFRSAG